MAFFKQENLVKQNDSCNKILPFKIYCKIENFYLQKSFEISWLLVKNLKKSYYLFYQQTILLKRTLHT